MALLYLDNAATSLPKPPALYARLSSDLEQYGGCPGRGLHPLARQADALLDETRRLLAALFGVAEPSRIVFACNATDALNMAIKGTLEPGDHVVTTALEHNSVSRPLAALERAGVIRVTRVAAGPDGLLEPGDVAQAITPRTKLVAVIHGSNVIGSLLPVGAIGRLVRERGSLLLVDASQTAGAVPIDVEAACIDLLAFPGHKALLGLPGTGGLYVGPRAEVGPWREGGTGIRSEEPLQPRELPFRLEAGSPNTLGLAGLSTALRFIRQEGIGRIRAHELALTRRLLEGLQGDDRFAVYGPARLEDRIAVVSLRIRGSKPEDVATALSEEHAIAVRAGLHCAPGAHRALGTFPEGAVRVSPGYFITEEQMEECLVALRKIASRRAAARRAAACPA
jgi:cysteine desulfurase family protein